MPFRYPIALELEGRTCVVVGGGSVGEHKARALLDAGARVRVIAEEFTEGLERAARRGELELVRKAYSHGDLAGAFLAIAATDDAAVNSAIFEEAEERHVLLNAVDDVEHCHFAVPSIVRRGDFVLAISTGGKAPALAKRLRAGLSDRFGSEYETLVNLLGEVREQTLVEREVDFDEWARRWQLALEEDLLGLVAQGRVEEAAGLVREILRAGGRRETAGDEPSSPEGDGRAVAASVQGGEAAAAGRVSIVGAGPGDPGLVTVRGKEALAAADVVVYDRLVHPSLLEGKTAIFAGKEPGRHCIDQAEINALLIRLAREGKDVVRLKGGDPFVFGRGAEEAEALAAAGIEFAVVPAPTSATAALAYAGIPLTDRRLSSSVAFVTGHCTSGREVNWRELASAVDTLVVLMGLRRVDEIVSELIAGGRDPATPSAVIENGTLPEQRVIRSDLAALPEAARGAGVQSPAIIVVGDVVGLSERIGWFEQSVADEGDPQKLQLAGRR